MFRIQTFLIVLFSISASADHHAEGALNACHMDYPAIDGELILENDQVVVQRFTIQPDQWEGIHRHPPHQLYIQLNDGDWSYKVGGSVDNFSLPAGHVSWNEAATDLNEQHESGNDGAAEISYLWVAIKPGCLATTP